ncbi:MAG: phage major capsid protein, partial [Cetobacterium sp.]
MPDGGLDIIQKGFDKIEGQMTAWAEKAKGEIETIGKVSAETKTALDALGTKQRELADELLQLKQRGVLQREEPKKGEDGWGEQVTKSEGYESFRTGKAPKTRIEVKNTLTHANTGVVQPERRPFVSGAFLPLTIEALLPSMPTDRDSIEFVKEGTFTSNAAAVAHAAAKPESSITTTLVTANVATVAHWLRVTKQLAADAPAFAAYVDTRLKYFVQLKAEQEIVSGNGVAPNISGMLNSGNFTPHGFADAALGGVLPKLVLARRMIAQTAAA